MQWVVLPCDSFLYYVVETVLVLLSDLGIPLTLTDKFLYFF